MIAELWATSTPQWVEATTTVDLSTSTPPPGVEESCRDKVVASRNFLNPFKVQGPIGWLKYCVEQIGATIRTGIDDTVGIAQPGIGVDQPAPVALGHGLAPGSDGRLQAGCAGAGAPCPENAGRPHPPFPSISMLLKSLCQRDSAIISSTIRPQP